MAQSPGSSYRETWYRERVEPAFAKGLEAPERAPILYEPNEAGPPYTPIPERRSWTHRARIGRVGLAMCTGDLPPTRDEWVDVRDWNDPLWPAEMFRVYFEPVGPAPVGANAK